MAPWLAKLINRSPKIRAIVQNSLPSFGIIIFNSVLPFFLSCKQSSHPIRGEMLTPRAVVQTGIQVAQCH